MGETPHFHTFATSTQTQAMILFFGTRTGKTRTFPLQGTNCPHCDQSGTLQAVVQPHFVHLFWIPVYRLKPFRTVHCSHCKGVFHMDELPSGIREALREQE